MKTPALIAFLAAAVTLAGCAGARKAESGSAGEGTGNIVSSSPRAERSGASGIRQNVVHFDFDSAVIKEDGRKLVAQWAEFLRNNRGARVTLEGHADERGTPEYNVALGERRANALRDLLVQQGVGAGQLSVTSMGEERPVDPGHNERAWRKNRRVEILD
jgi:peptidoglycan-associated lipoprotein